jgi:broad specificity phosphatase PhoE
MTALTVPSRSFLCLRHGMTDWNKQGRFQGLTDNTLNEEGVAQAHAAARRLERVAVDAIVSSPLRRAIETADIAAAALLKPVNIDTGIIECDFGSLEGRLISDAMREHGITAMQDLVSILPADGEAWTTVSQRAALCERVAGPPPRRRYTVRLP